MIIEYEERVRQCAYQLWEEEGRPVGRAEVHWEKARELVAIEDNQDLATKPVPRTGSIGPYGEPVEAIEAAENAGGFSTRTDQGEEKTFPERRKES